MGKTYKYLLFDADDTLFDYQKAEQTALEDTFKSFALTFDDAMSDMYNVINARLWEALERGEVTRETLRVQRFKDLFDYYQISVNPVQFSASYLTALGNGTALIENAIEVVETLLEQGYQLAIITNGFYEVQTSRLSQSEIGRLIPQVFVSERVGFQKPEIEFFEIVLQEMGIKQQQYSQVLVIGDSVSADIQGAINMGLDSCWVNLYNKEYTLEQQPTYEIKKLKELLTIL